jgi:hypothetical protein
MSRYMAVHTLPMTEEKWMEDMNANRDKLGELPSGMAYHSTYCDFNDNKFFCDWEAPNKESLEQVFKNLEMPFDAIYPVKLFDVAQEHFVD